MKQPKTYHVWRRFYLPFYFEETIQVMCEWLKECCRKKYKFELTNNDALYTGGQWRPIPRWIEFEDDRDAMLFRLRWL